MAVAFWVCAVLAVIGALGMVLSKKAVHSALWVANTMINLAVLYALLDAQFLSMVQIIVYTGAVMMLFLFVLMIVGVDASDSLVETLRGHRLLSVLAIAVFATILVTAVVQGSADLFVAQNPTGVEGANGLYGGNVEGLANLMFGRYVLAVQATAALLITAALGALVLAHRERHTPFLSQKRRAQVRMQDLAGMAPLPPPGVYSRHNAVDTPALLPDGSTSEISVPGPLRARGTIGAIDEVSITPESVEGAEGREPA